MATVYLCFAGFFYVCDRMCVCVCVCVARRGGGGGGGGHLAVSSTSILYCCISFAFVSNYVCTRIRYDTDATWISMLLDLYNMIIRK